MDFIIAIFAMLLFAAVWAVVCAIPVMMLWNYAAVSALHVERLDLLQALCLAWLCSILFKPSVK